MSETHHATDRNLDRMLFFSDAVFAIVLTLLVLELRPPAGEAGDAERLAGVLALAPHFLAYFASFALVGLWWSLHMRLMRPLKIFDWPTAIFNLVFLSSVGLLPFAAALWGESFNSPFTMGVFWGLGLLCAVMMLLLVIVVLRGGGRLVGGVTRREWIGRIMQSLGTIVAFGIGVWAAWAGEVWIERFCWVAMFPIQALGRRIARPTKGAPARANAAAG